MANAFSMGEKNSLCATTSSLRNVYGVGERKLAAYGEAFFDALSKGA